MTEFYFGNFPDHLFALPVLRADKTEVLRRFPEGSRNAGAVAESERNGATAGVHTHTHWIEQPLVTLWVYFEGTGGKVEVNRKERMRDVGKVLFRVKNKVLEVNCKQDLRESFNA